MYGVHTKGSRLHWISQMPKDGFGKPRATEYFENMSRAMARMCSGQIYLVTELPFNLPLFKRGGPYYPNIWTTTEWPELTTRLVQGVVSDWGLVVIEYTTMPVPKPRAWKVNWRTFYNYGETQWQKREEEEGGDGADSPPAGWEPYDLGAELRAGGNRGPQLQKDRQVA